MGLFIWFKVEFLHFPKGIQIKPKKMKIDD